MRSLEPPSRSSDCAIVLCADRKFFAPAYSVCMSLVRHQPERNDIYLLTEEGPHLQKVPSDVPFNVMTPEFVHRLPNIPEIWHHWTPFAFLRLFLPDIIPGYRRILYLDCDIRIEGSVAPLFGLDMKGAAIAAVDDVMTFFKPTIRSEIAPVEKGRRALGFGPDEPYFNSGVLLIDCDRWQRDRMTDAATDCIVRLRTHLLLDQDVLNVIQLDQDVLNVIFRKAWLPLSPRWNFPSSSIRD